MDPKRIDKLLEELGSSEIPPAPPPHAILREIRRLRESGKTPEFSFAWLSWPQLATATGACALIVGLAVGVLNAVSPPSDSKVVVRESFGLSVFDADSTGLPHQMIVSR